MNQSKSESSPARTSTLDQVVDLTLLANFLHQVINPMNGICGTLDNIVNGQVPKGNVPQRLRAARAQLEHCTTLIRNLAFFSEFGRDPAGYRERNKDKLCVVPRTLIESMMVFQELARSKQMKLHLVDRDTQYKLHADPNLLRQAFMNIFDNYIKYGNPKSDVVINCGIHGQNELFIEVSGFGPPVPQDEWEKIFEAGFRGENAKQIIASGTGLGLFICRLIITSVYLGTIDYRVRKKDESVFTIRLPGVWI